MEKLSVTIQMKSTEQYFPVVLIIAMHISDITFESDKIQHCIELCSRVQENRYKQRVNIMPILMTFRRRI